MLDVYKRQHANSCKDMLKRIETMVLMGVDMPVEAIRGQMASAIDVIIHLGRSFDGSRKLMEISEITGMAASQVALHPLFEMNEDDEPVSYTHLDVYKRQSLS